MATKVYGTTASRISPTKQAAINKNLKAAAKSTAVKTATTKAAATKTTIKTSAAVKTSVAAKATIAQTAAKKATVTVKKATISTNSARSNTASVAKAATAVKKAVTATPKTTAKTAVKVSGNVANTVKKVAANVAATKPVTTTKTAASKTTAAATAVAGKVIATGAKVASTVKQNTAVKQPTQTVKSSTSNTAKSAAAVAGIAKAVKQTAAPKTTAKPTTIGVSGGVCQAVKNVSKTVDVKSTVKTPQIFTPKPILVGVEKEESLWDKGVSTVKDIVTDKVKDFAQTSVDVAKEMIKDVDLMDVVHTALDGAGMVWGYGVLADLANAGLYALEKDYVNASLSLIAAAPGGQSVTAAKYAGKAGKTVAKTIDTVYDAKKTYDKVSNLANTVDNVKEAAKWYDGLKDAVERYMDIADAYEEVNNSTSLKNIYNSIKESPEYPEGFQPRPNGTKSNKINNIPLLEQLRKIESGTWKKVYKDGYDKYGNEISIHYFQSESGKVFNVKVKDGWSNN